MHYEVCSVQFAECSVQCDLCIVGRGSVVSCVCVEDVWGGDRCGGDQGGSHSQLCGGEGEAGVQGQCALREAGPEGRGGAHLSGGVQQGITLGRGSLIRWNNTESNTREGLTYQV